VLVKLVEHQSSVRVLAECARQMNKCMLWSLLQVLVKWNIQRGVPVLVKTGTESRLKENLWGMLDYKLTDGQMVREGGRVSRLVDV